MWEIWKEANRQRRRRCNGLGRAWTASPQRTQRAMERCRAGDHVERGPPPRFQGAPPNTCTLLLPTTDPPQTTVAGSTPVSHAPRLACLGSARQSRVCRLPIIDADDAGSRPCAHRQTARPQVRQTHAPNTHAYASTCACAYTRMADGQAAKARRDRSGVGPWIYAWSRPRVFRVWGIGADMMPDCLLQLSLSPTPPVPLPHSLAHTHHSRR